MSLKTQPTENESSASSQNEVSTVSIVKAEGTAVPSTSKCSNDIGEYGMQVVVQVATTRNVTIPIVIAREQARYDNLIANRGVKSYSTSSEE